MGQILIKEYEMTHRLVDVLCIESWNLSLHLSLHQIGCMTIYSAYFLIYKLRDLDYISES